MNNDSKMPIVLIGNSFKYETEATLKLFFNTARFTFINDRNMIEGDRYVVAEVCGDSEPRRFIAEVCLGGEPVITEGEASSDKLEHEICRAIFHTLCRLTGIRPPWGIMTGIRPVKKVTELIEKGLDKEQIRSELTERFELMPDKFELAYRTAVNQLPILEKIDRSAASLYVSIPFCPTRCSYCSFVSHSMDSARKLMPEYISALCRELEILGNIVRETGTVIDTIYFGGGTPTSISADELRAVMEAVGHSFDISSVREYNVEAGRPDTITEEKLRVIKELGASRISVNPQTLNDDVLRVIGRQHSGEDAIRAFELARSLGFDNINTDLIAGLPSESPESFRRTLDRICELSPESITIHTLTLKRSADLFGFSEGNIGNPAAEMVDYSIEKLHSCGYLPYYMYRQKNTIDNLENVGYTKNGYACRYNIDNMEETTNILAFGSGSISKRIFSSENRIERAANVKDIVNFCQRTDEMIRRKKELFGL